MQGYICAWSSVQQHCGPGVQLIKMAKIEMGDSNDRHRNRDSLFVMADMRLDETKPVHRIKIRNLSTGGLMAEGAIKAAAGTSLEIDIRNIGWVAGSVAWVAGARFGVAFAEDIDPMLARAPAAVTNPQDHQSGPVYRPVSLRTSAAQGAFRKI